jgi:dihydroorotate dehydrogenase electron transfer subunit
VRGDEQEHGLYLTAPAPRPAQAVQRVVQVVDRRPVAAHVEFTLAAPEIAERAQPGRFVGFAVGGPTPGLLLRRSIAIGSAQEGALRQRGFSSVRDAVGYAHR